ncbi:MAG: DNA repair protein RadA [Eubacteriales bacterium]|nr:DNA repair protein RadA [Eubacteriales bacterium]MDD3196979.1 DNA repair protein RadA [Eubacteriales bacterium]MDD4681754.1 DNA repair protein RadA [Eubacteriales bacterium]
MAKTKSSFYCTECGHETSGWLGRCPGCGSWNTMQEALKPAAQDKKGRRGNWAESDDKQNLPIGRRIVTMNEIESKTTLRQPSQLSELDRVLGGGFVQGSLVLIGGDPGIGKSTLLLQVAGKWQTDGSVLYISGEESLQQIRMRSDRLGIDTSAIKLLAATDFTSLSQAISETRPQLAIVDSIQTMYAEELSAAPGSVSQVREVTAGLLRLAKQLSVTIVLVGHVTKDGAIAGPRVLEHMVDTVLYFEGENLENYRMLRAVKNRFGATDELGVFEMTQQGLVSVDNASMVLLAGRPQKVAGSVVTACMEGTRPILLEIQALVNETSGNFALRMAQGYDRNRLNMLLAVAEKHLGTGFQNFDTYVNVIGGLKITETAADLALLAAVLSSVNDQPIREHTLICGEVGLTGEIRAVAQADRRAIEASRMGMSSIILPSGNKRQLENCSLPDNFELYFVDKIKEAIDIIFS